MPREIFKLIGMISTRGVEDTEGHLKAIDKQAKKVAKSLGKAGRAAEKMGKNLTKFVTVPMIGMAAAGFKAAQAASELSEQQDKAKEIFGASSAEIEKWSDTAATAFGQSKKQATEAASNFALFGKMAGLAGSDLTEFSTDLVELGSDMASFNDADPSETLAAIGAGLRGESEPLRRFGVLLNEATLRARALKMGLVDTTKEALTPQQKVLAAQAEIMKQTAVQQGNFQKTIEGAANAQRVLKAQLDDVVANLGQAFLPILIDVVKWLNTKLVPLLIKASNWFKDMSPNVRRTVVQLAALAAVLGPTIMLVGKIVMIGKSVVLMVKAWAAAQGILNAVMTANPIGLVITAIAALVAAGIVLVNNWDWVKEKAAELWDAMTFYVLQGVNFAKELLISYVQLYVHAIDKIGQFIPGVAEKLDQAKAKLKEWKDASKEERRERKLARIESKKQKVAVDEVAEAVKAAKAATAEHTISVATNTQAVKDNKKAAEERAAAEEKRNEDRVALEEEYTAKVRENTLTKMELLELENAAAIEKAEELGAETHAIQEFYQLERQRLWEEEAAEKDRLREEEKAKEAAKYEQIKNTSIQAINQIFSLMRQATQNKITLVNNELAAEKKAIQASSMAEDQKIKAIEAAEEKADQKKRQLMTKQAKRDKAAAIFAAVVNTAQAISKALTLGVPVGIIMAAVMGVLGAVQIGIIASRPIPQFAEGGMVKGGMGGITAQVGEGREDELVMPLESGVNALLDSMFARLRTMDRGGQAAAPAESEGAEATGGGLHFHIGTMIADDTGIKELGRKVRGVIVSDNERMALAGA